MAYALLPSLLSLALMACSALQVGPLRSVNSQPGDEPSSRLAQLLAQPLLPLPPPCAACALLVLAANRLSMLHALHSCPPDRLLHWSQRSWAKLQTPPGAATSWPTRALHKAWTAPAPASVAAATRAGPAS